jgi:hypothetical protein
MTSEESKAVQELSKFGTKALGSSDKLGGFLAKVFGTVPEDAVGVLGGIFYIMYAYAILRS